jgi:hypothetical protein
MLRPKNQQTCGIKSHTINGGPPIFIVLTALNSDQLPVPTEAGVAAVHGWEMVASCCSGV